MRSLINKQSGVALVTLLIFVAVGLTVIAGSVAVSIITTQGTTELEGGENTYFISESGIEEAILILLRDPNYSGSTLTIGDATDTITVTGDSAKTIVSEGVLGSHIRRIQIDGSFSGGVFSISSWGEIN